MDKIKTVFRTYMELFKNDPAAQGGIANPNKTLAIVSLIMGIVSILISCGCITGIGLGGGALFLSYKSMSEKRDGWMLAKIGGITGAVGAVLGSLVGLGWGLFFFVTIVGRIISSIF
jgi:hypothetical protein